MSWLYWLKLLLLVCWSKYWFVVFVPDPSKLQFMGFVLASQISAQLIAWLSLSQNVSGLTRRVQSQRQQWLSPSRSNLVSTLTSWECGSQTGELQNQLLARTQVQHQNGRRQKDKRIASGGSASAGAAYRNPSTDGQPPSSSTAAAANPTDGPAAPAGTTPIKVINYKTWSIHVLTLRKITFFYSWFHY